MNIAAVMHAEHCGKKCFCFLLLEKRKQHINKMYRCNLDKCGYLPNSVFKTQIKIDKTILTNRAFMYFCQHSFPS